jgi:predicted RNA-binding Zn ribbon-like protein
VAETDTSTSIFEFTGNRLCLDFTNTVQDRAVTPRELLHSYSDLLTWSEQAHILSQSEAQHLHQQAEQHRGEAQTILHEAIAIRETIYRICQAIATGSVPARADLDAFNDMLAQAMSQACLQLQGEDFIWEWRNKSQALKSVLWPIVRSAADVLTSEDRERVRICAADDCNWLFLDTSKNHSRRWCDMKSCGNRAKVRKHYSHKKHSAS